MKDDLDLIKKITSLRIAVAHPEANKNWLNEHIMIAGAQIFKGSDVEIQYGAHSVFLIKEIMPIYKKIREVFASSPELVHLRKSRSWDMDNQTIADIEKSLSASLDSSQVEKLWRK